MYKFHISYFVIVWICCKFCNFGIFGFLHLEGFYDSRLIHCGGNNLLSHEGGARRRVLVATFVNVKARPVPRAAACAIRRELRGRHRLRSLFGADQTIERGA